MYKTTCILFCFITAINSYSQKSIAIYKNESLKKNVKLNNNLKTTEFTSDSLVLYDNGTYKQFDKLVFYGLGIIDNDQTTGTWEKNNNQLILRPKTLTRSGVSYEEDVSFWNNIVFVIKNDSLINYEKTKNRVIKQLKRVILENQ